MRLPHDETNFGIGTLVERAVRSIENADLSIGLVLALGKADEIAKDERIVRAHAGRRSCDVAGRGGEIKARKAVGVVSHLRVSPHTELAAREELRIAEQAGHGHDGICSNAARL